MDYSDLRLITLPPETIYNQLQELDLSGTRLITLPEAIGRLSTPVRLFRKTGP